MVNERTKRAAVVALLVILAAASSSSWAGRSWTVKGPMADRRTLAECRSMIEHRKDLGELPTRPAEALGALQPALELFPLDARLQFQDSKPCTLEGIGQDAGWICSQLGGELGKPRKVQTADGIHGEVLCTAVDRTGRRIPFRLVVRCSE